MAELHEILATPLEVMVGGKPYRISPLTDCDRSELQLWMRARYLSLAEQSVKEQPPEVKIAVLAQATDKAFQLTVVSEEADGLLSHDIDAISYLLWLSLRHEHPQITREDVLQLISDRSIIAAMYEKLELITETLSKKNGRHRVATRSTAGTRRRSISHWLSDMVGRLSKSAT